MSTEKILRGEKIVLRPIREGGELERIRQWRNDPRNAGFFFTDHKIAPDEHARWFESMKSAADRGVFAIVLAETDEAIGSFSYRIDRVTEEVLYGVMIGPAEMRGRGYGEEAERLISGEMSARGVKTAVVEVFANNDAAVGFYRKIGYETESVAVGREQQEGKPRDVLIMKKKIGR